MIVGIATTVLAVVFALLEKRRAVRWLGVVALVLVSIQGVLGGLRVVLYEHGLAPVHGCFAQAFFAFMAGLVAVTSPAWRDVSPASSGAQGAKIRKLALALAGVTYLQVMLGAWVRHVALARIEPHAVTAFAIFALAIVLVRAIKRAQATWLAKTCRRLHAVLGMQILLGLASWLVKPMELSPDVKVVLVSTHLMMGALVLGTTVALALQAHRAFASSEQAGSKVASPALARQAEEVTA
jgi:cytochrome c oxidase assembly protein subunit 15